MKFRVFAIFLVCSVQSVFGQTDYSFQHYSHTSGMSDSYITGISEDASGKIWISTNFGINVFNGKSFDQFMAEDAHLHNMIRNDVNCVYIDTSKKIWIGGHNGTIQTYNTTYDRFDNVSLNHITLDEYPSFHAFYQKYGSELYGLSSKGLYRFSQYSGKFHKAFRELHELHSTQTTCMYIDSKGTMVLGTRKQGVILISSDSTHIVKIPIHAQSIEQPRINCILHLSDTTYYIGTSHGVVHILLPKHGKPIVKQVFEIIADEFISSLCTDGDGNIWIGTGYKGVWIQKNHAALQQLNLTTEQHAMTSGVTVLFKDSKHRMWIGTPGNGLFLYNPHSSYITHIDESKGLQFPIVSAITTDEQGNIWVGTDGGGISIYSINMKLIRHIHKGTGLPSDAVLSFAQSPSHMWVSTWRGGIGSIDKKTFTVRTYNEDNSDLRFNGVKSIAWYAPDTLVVGSHGEGIQLFNTKTQTFIQDFVINYSSYFPDEQKFITQVAVDNHKNIWVATIRNLYCVQNKTVKDVLASDNFENPQNPLFVSSICFDKAGYIVAGTNKGVYRINTLNCKVEKIIESHEYFSQTVNVSVYVVNAEQYWIANTKGLFVYNPITGEAKKLMLSAHANRMFFVPRAMYASKNGYLHIGTYQGMYSCALHTVFPKQANIVLEFAHLYIDHQKTIAGGVILPEALSNTKHLKIPYTTQNKSITFRTICYEFPHTLEFAYKFEGFDAAWQNLGNIQEIQCNNLPPGTYTLKIKAWQNNSDTAVETSILITILPPWWKTWWFITVCVCIAIIVLWIVYKLRMHTIQRERKELQHEVQAQLSSLKLQKDCIEEQHNELCFVSEKLEESNSMLLMQKQELEELTKQLQEESVEISELNASLKQSNITKEQLFTMITHDIYNSFESLELLAHKLQSFIVADSHKKPIITTISNNIQNHKELLKNLIIWAKNQTNSIDVTMQLLQVNQFIDELIKNTESIAQEKNCTVSFKNKDVDTVYADSHLLLIALRTLLYSVIQGSSSGSFILLTAEAKKDQVELRIQISLQGIDEQLLSHTLQYKKQYKKEKTYSIDSQNLHIIVSQQCIEKNNGTFTILHSKESGLQYIINLQHKAPQQNAEEIKNTQVPMQLKIAILDDNPAIVRLCHDYISQQYNVVSSTDPKEFLDIYEEYMPDILISDIAMPDIDGYNVCKIVKQKYGIPVILISSNKEDAIKQYAYQCGADAYIDKPVSKDVLLAVIKNIETHITTQPTGKQMIVNEVDDEAVFLKKFEHILSKNIANTAISVEDIAMQMNVSRTQLFRKIKQIHAMSPKEYLIKIRMQTAGELLKTGETKIIDVAYAVGFSDPSYFTKCFIKFYGISPSEYKG